MNEASRDVARRFMQTYADGDVDGLFACLTDGWQLHDEDGGTTTHAALAEITRMHADAFPKKSIEYLHEVAEADLLAQHVRFTLLHSGRYFDIDATGDQVELSEMIFHRMEGTLIAESWRMTFPDSVYQALTVRPETS